MFVRKKNIKGKEYYYLVVATRREDGSQKKIEHYLGLHLPSKKEMKEYEKEFSGIKLFFEQNKLLLQTLQKKYQTKLVLNLSEHLSF